MGGQPLALEPCMCKHFTKKCGGSPYRTQPITAFPSCGHQRLNDKGHVDNMGNFIKQQQKWGGGDFSSFRLSYNK